MVVGSFDPQSKNDTSEVKAADMAELLATARQLNDRSLVGKLPEQWAEGLGLSQLSQARLAAVATHAPGKGGADWARAGQELPDEDVVSLIRLFTLAESNLPGWESGAKSPVVPLAALLRQRDAYPKGLTAWIKANTDNRFLPYGSLMDRL